MQPMQPFQPFPQESAVPSSRSGARPLPGSLKLILGLKALGCLLTSFLSMLVMMALSDRTALPEGMTVAMAHQLGQLAMIATGVSIVELLGVAGTWTFKRWGVFVLATFSMLNFAIRMSGHDSFGAILSLGTTALAGLVIAARWREFE
jgi:hypothetical protein